MGERMNFPSFLFLGEKRSKKAVDLNVSWKDGKLCAGTLFRALTAVGYRVNPHHFHNLWYDDGEMNPNTLRFAQGAAPFIIALGNKVSGELRRLKIAHRKMIHPAARGRIRTTKAYFSHVKRVLQKGEVLWA